jgi:hypothetical protein
MQSVVGVRAAGEVNCRGGLMEERSAAQDAIAMLTASEHGYGSRQILEYSDVDPRAVAQVLTGSLLAEIEMRVGC